MKPRRNPLSKRLGSALVMTLVIIVLITVVTVGYLASVMLETRTATSTLDQEKAYGFAMVGVHQAIAKVRAGLGPWDDPYKNFATNVPPFYWSFSPGRITQWQYSSLASSNVALFSESSTTSLVNLNRPLSDGSYPIIGGSNAPDVSVKWVNLPADPSQALASNNPIVGRYAFWVDSESAKINVNTADGTAKYQTNSLGIGSPSEVSLQALRNGTSGQISQTTAQAIVDFARTSNFQSAREVLRAAGATNITFDENAFFLTTYSRSPDLNVFGQPKMALLPLLGTAFFYPDWDENVPGTIRATNMVINGITLRPGNEIYPTPSQLPPYVLTSPVFSNSAIYSDLPAGRAIPWPLAFRAEATQGLGRRQEYRQFPRISIGTNYCYINGALLANYLAGINAAGQPVTWPAFPSSLGANFLTKYTGRQIDSIVAQIVSLGSKLISSDFPYPRSTDYPTSLVTKISDGKGDSHADAYGQERNRYNNAPFLFPGWLSSRFVNGMGRSMKLSGLRMKVTAFESYGEMNTTNYHPPEASMDIWIEWWVPSGFSGDTNAPLAIAAGMEIGHNAHKGLLNSADVTDKIDQLPPFPPGPLPKSPTGSPRSFWANQMLTNNQGIDFACNPRQVPRWGIVDLADPDQGLAATFHDPYARPAPPDYYVGQGGEFQESGFQTPLRVSSPMQPGDDEFSPGEVRSVGSRYETFRMPMQTNAAGSSLEIGGGIAVRGQLLGGYWSDPDPVPLEAIRGATRPDPLTANHTISVDIDTQEPVSDFDNPQWNMPLLTVEQEPGMFTLYDRVKKSVIPVALSTNVPPHSAVPTGAVSSAEFFAAPDDPLVNKFPGDWEVRGSSTIRTTTPPRGRLGSTEAYNSYSESTTSWYSAANFDPDSYWLPQMDCGVSRFDDLPDRTRIPRSARMPNVGYLQYVRTGIIPDNESAPYQTQHGTPFRLLNFAPSQNQTNYPDWALLDLLYVPSTLIPYGSRYNPSTNVPMNNSASTNLAVFGTYGGATAGRINPNGAVIYTTNVNTPEAVSRTLPLQAVVHGVMANGANVPADTIAGAIEAYIRANGPLRIPAQICNVPTIATWAAPINPTRNDLVRQIVGNLTTQENVFSVWTVGQAIRKKPANNQYDDFEPGDNILAEVRLHFVVERFLDPGADGVYGNSSDPGEDSVVGSYDDPMNSTNHPFQPRYLYRVVASEELR